MKNYLKYKSYIASIEFSAEDEVFYGKVHGINDLVSFEGNSVSQLKKAFRDAVEDYLELCRKQKRQPDKTYKGSFNIRLSADLHRMAAFTASSKHISLNELVSKAVSYALSNEKDVLNISE